MGQTESHSCVPNLTDPDEISVVVLSDSCMQRLPLAKEDDNPIEREDRNENIDQFWYSRLACIDKVYSDAAGINEENFNRLLQNLEKYSTGIKKRDTCTSSLSNVAGCFERHSTEPLKCHNHINNYNSCVDAQTKRAVHVAFEETKKQAQKLKVMEPEKR